MFCWMVLRSRVQTKDVLFFFYYKNTSLTISIRCTKLLPSHRKTTAMEWKAAIHVETARRTKWRTEVGSLLAHLWIPLFSRLKTKDYTTFIVKKWSYMHTQINVNRKDFFVRSILLSYSRMSHLYVFCLLRI